MYKYKVHTGNRWRKFATLADASQFCETVFQKTGVVLSIRERVELERAIADAGEWQIGVNRLHAREK